LRKSGYVKSIRGAQGGYTLSKDPAQISVGDILRVMEGPIALVDCLLEHSDNHDCCEREGICVTRDVWAKVCDSIITVVDSISLADLCREEKIRGDV
jgi:Rrf2 family protein